MATRVSGFGSGDSKNTVTTYSGVIKAFNGVVHVVDVGSEKKPAYAFCGLAGKADGATRTLTVEIWGSNDNKDFSLLSRNQQSMNTNAGSIMTDLKGYNGKWRYYKFYAACTYMSGGGTNYGVTVFD